MWTGNKKPGDITDLVDYATPVALIVPGSAYLRAGIAIGAHLGARIADNYLSQKQQWQLQTEFGWTPKPVAKASRMSPNDSFMHLLSLSLDTHVFQRLKFVSGP